LLEPLVRTRTQEDDESVASFVRRRLGREVLDYAVDPFISGIFAGDPETLSMAHAFPRVAELERRHGSLSKGLMMQRKQFAGGEHGDDTAGMTADTKGHLMSSSAPIRARLISFVDGM